MNDLGTLTVGLGVDTKGLIDGFATARDHISGFGGAVAGLLIGSTVAVAGLGVGAVKMAGDFQSSITLLQTGAAESASNLKLVGDGILSMAGQVGESTKQLTGAMFIIDSANIHGAQSLTVLRDAAEGAKVGAADVADVANGITTIMTDYANKNVTAAQATNTLIAAVSLGKTHLQDLSVAMAHVLPTASALGVSLNDVEGAMATMTAEGVPAADAATYLRQMLVALAAPASAGAKALANIGLTTQQVSDDMKKSLPDTLQMIMDHLKATYTEGSPQYTEALKNIAGGSKQLQAELDLTGTHMATFKTDVKDVSDAVKKGGDSIIGWSTVQGDFNTKMDQAKGAVEALGIKIGTVLLPVAGTLMGYVTPLIQHFSDWADQGNNLQGVLNTIGGVIRDDVISPAEKLYNAVEPIVADFIKWNDKTHFLQNTLHDVGDLINRVAGYIATNIIPPVRTLIGHLQDWLTKSNFVHDALKTLGDVIGTVSGVVGTLVGWISGLVGWFAQSKPAADFLKDALIGIGVAILGIKLVGFIGDVITLGMKMYETASKIGQGIGNIVNGDIPALKASLVGVGTTAETTMAAGVAAGAAEAKASIVSISGSAAGVEIAEAGIGTTMKTTVAADVEAGALASEASIASVGVEAESTAATVKLAGAGMGLSFLGLIPVVGLAAAAIPLIGAAAADSAKNLHTAFAAQGFDLDTFAKESSKTATLMHDSWVSHIKDMKTVSVTDIDGMRTEITKELTGLLGLSTAEATRLANEWLKETGKMKDGSATNFRLMAQNASNETQKMAQDAIANATLLASKTEAIFQKMGDFGTSILAQIDQNSQVYWNRVAATLDEMKAAADQAAAQVAYDMQIQSTGGTSGRGIYNQNNFGPGHALGGRDIPPGGYFAGEHGVEWITPSVPTNVYTAQETASMFSGAPPLPALPRGGYGYGSGGGSGLGPLRLELHLHQEVNGREVAHAVAEDSIAVDTLGSAMVSHLRARTAVRM